MSVEVMVGGDGGEGRKGEGELGGLPVKVVLPPGFPVQPIIPPKMSAKSKMRMVPPSPLTLWKKGGLKMVEICYKAIL